MLLLGRKEGESIYLPTIGIEVKVIEIRPHLVRLGVSAPRDIPVLRHDTKDTRGVELRIFSKEEPDGVGIGEGEPRPTA